MKKKSSPPEDITHDTNLVHLVKGVSNYLLICIITN